MPGAVTIRRIFLPALLLLGAGALLIAVGPASGAEPSIGVPGPGDWPMFLHDNQRNAWNSDEYALSLSTAPHLQLKWQVQLSGSPIVASPSVVGDRIYIGSWDGNEYALNTADGSVIWKIFIGTSQANLPACNPQQAGVTAAAAVDNGMVYVGGGAEYFYGLDAATGNPIWRIFTGISSPQGGNYNWASALVSRGRVYSAIASFCDRPLVRGFIWGADAASGQNERRAYTVPENVLGAGIWTSPTLDESHNRMFATTGSPPDAVGYVDSIVAVDLNSYNVSDAWRVPPQDEVADADWGTTPTLYTLPDGKLMVAAANKNGIFYAFDANRLSAGPVWQVRIANGGECPQCGEAPISSSVYRDGVLYVGAGATTVNGVNVGGSVRAIDAATGAVKWVRPTGGAVVASQAGANGVLIAAGDYQLFALNAADGNVLWLTNLKASVWGAPSVSHGVVYVPSIDGNLYAFEVPANLIPPSPTPTSPPTPTAQPTATPTPKPAPPDAVKPVSPPGVSGVLYFSQTGHTLAPPLLAYWQQYGGLAQFGYPITEPFTETLNMGGQNSKSYMVQYFERARFEYHPEYAGTPNEVLLGLLGTRFHAPEPSAPTNNSPGYVQLNGHNLGGPFLNYWQTHGGLFVNGYPISEERDELSPTNGKTYRVQYFERVRMEYHPEYAGTPNEVLLGLLGTQLLKENGWLP